MDTSPGTLCIRMARWAAQRRDWQDCEKHLKDALGHLKAEGNDRQFDMVADFLNQVQVRIAGEPFGLYGDEDLSYRGPRCPQCGTPTENMGTMVDGPYELKTCSHCGMDVPGMERDTEAPEE